jgi:hypothetical protein
MANQPRDDGVGKSGLTMLDDLDRSAMQSSDERSG